GGIPDIPTQYLEADPNNRWWRLSDPPFYNHDLSMPRRVHIPTSTPIIKLGVGCIFSI
ncbi:hypothetical protein ANANG_G00298900, partial [Anguilla anguilla]